MMILALAGTGLSSGILPKLLLLALAAVVAITILSRLKIPAVPAMLLAGALIGPNGFGLVGGGGEELLALADLGVALLLFGIGLEFTRDRLQQLGLRSLFAAVLQVGLSFGLVFFAARLLGADPRMAVFYGMVLCLSSTAVVIRSLADRQELEAPHGRLVLATLIVQDIIAVVLLVAVQFLAPGGDGGAGGQALRVLAVSAVFIVVVIVARQFLITPLMRVIDALRSREAYILTVLVLGLGTAVLSGLSGLSPALGAFLAGLMLAGSKFSHRTVAEIIPFREVFISLFFLSMGMLFNAGYLISNPLAVGALVLAIIIGKGVVSSLGVLLLRFPARIALLFGLGLAQFGEFGFLLMEEGIDRGIVNAPGLTRGTPELDLLLCAGLITMFLTPLILNLSPHLTAGEAILRPLERLLGARGIDEPQEGDRELFGHMLIAGYGPAAREITAYLREHGVPYIIIELNAQNVRRARQAGESIYYGDATSVEALSHARIEHARAVILLIKDPAGAERAVSACRQLVADTPVLARAQFATQIDSLRELGATYVAVDELTLAGNLLDHLRHSCGIEQPKA